MKSPTGLIAKGIRKQQSQGFHLQPKLRFGLFFGLLFAGFQMPKLLGCEAFARSGSMVKLASAAKPESAILPNGRRITALGDWIPTAPFPSALTQRQDGEQLVAPSLDFSFALNGIDRPQSADRKTTQIPLGFLSTPNVEAYTGVAYSPDGRLLYVATGDSGAVGILSTKDWTKVGRIDLNGNYAGYLYKESFAASLVLSRRGHQLYVIDEANWRVVVIDTATKIGIASLHLSQ